MDEMQKVELSPQAKEARKQYQKQWRATHKDAIRERNRRYWERRAARIAAEVHHEQTEKN